ncbi:MAG TPA: M55 family metallopeptidase, partial [Bacilli bacterium]
GWEGRPEMMMEGLSSEFDAVLFIGYHSGSLSFGNSLSHTLSLKVQKITINNQPATEFLVNALYASTLKVPVAFLSGDENLTQEAKVLIPGIKVVATKKGMHGASLSKHPNITNKEIEEKVFLALTKDYKQNLIPIPKEFNVEVEYRTHKEAYSASFYPKAELKNDYTVGFSSDNFYEVLRFFKFVL